LPQLAAPNNASANCSSSLDGCSAACAADSGVNSRRSTVELHGDDDGRICRRSCLISSSRSQHVRISLFLANPPISHLIITHSECHLSHTAHITASTALEGFRAQERTWTNKNRQEKCSQERLANNANTGLAWELESSPLKSHRPLQSLLQKTGHNQYIVYVVCTFGAALWWRIRMHTSPHNVHP